MPAFHFSLAFFFIYKYNKKYNIENIRFIYRVTTTAFAGIYLNQLQGTQLNEVSINARHYKNTKAY